MSCLSVRFVIILSMLLYLDHAMHRKRVKKQKEVMALITEAQVRSSYRLLEGSRQVGYSNARERKFWESIAHDIIRDHVTGKKKTSIAEAGILYAINSRAKQLNESPHLIREESWLKRAVGAVGKAAKSVMMGVGKGVAKGAKVVGNVTGANFARSRNWWLFGGGGEEKDQEYRAAYVDSLNKRNEIIDKVFDRSIGDMEMELQKRYGYATAGKSAKSGEAGPQNVPDPETFKQIIAAWVGIYAQICAAAGEKVEGFENLQVRTGAERIPVEAANEAIESIRKIFEAYDRFLFDGYANTMDLRGSSDIFGNTKPKGEPGAEGFKEGRRSRLSLVEAMGLDEETGNTDKSKIGQQGRQTSTMDMLKSNLAPGVIAALGAATAATGLLVQTQWFINLTSEISKVTDTVQVDEVSTEYVDETLGEVTSANGGRGLEIYLQKVWGANLNAGSSLEDARAAFAKIGGGDWRAGLEAATQNGEGPLGHGYPDAGKRIAEFLEGKTGATKWGDAYGQLGTGTHKIAGDMLQLDVGTIKARLAREVTKRVTKEVTKEVVKQGATWAGLTAAGPILTILGASAIVAAVSLKALRMWGAENSRASYINSFLQKLKDLPPRQEEEEEGQAPPVKPPIPEPKPPGSKVITVRLDDNGTYFVYPVNNIAEGDSPEDWKVDDDVFTMPGYERPGKIPVRVKNDKDEEEEIRGTEKLKKMCAAILEGDKKGGADVGVKDLTALNDFKWLFSDKRTEGGAGGGEGDDKDKDKDKKPKRTAPGQGSLVRVDLTTGEKADGIGNVQEPIGESYHPSLRDLMFEAGEVRRIGTTASGEMKKKWKGLGDEARKSPSGVPKDRAKFPTPEDTFLTAHKIDKKAGVHTNLATYDDRVIRRGLKGIRGAARSGNVVLGFENDAIVALKKAGVPERMHRAILQIYAMDPNSPPQKMTAYIDALEKAGVSEDDLKKINRGAFEEVLNDIGMLAKPTKKPTKKPTSESYSNERVGRLLREIAADDLVNENRANEDENVLERWQKLAGLID